MTIRKLAILALTTLCLCGAQRRLTPIEQFAVRLDAYIDRDTLGSFKVPKYPNQRAKWLRGQLDQLHGNFKDIEHAVHEGVIDPAAQDCLLHTAAILYTMDRIIQESK